MENIFISDVSPEILTKGFLHLRWYNLLFATGVLGSLPLGFYMWEKSGQPREKAEALKGYLILSVLLGARLGHVIFYDWNYYKHRILEIFLPVTFSPSFKITGFSGLASHGAVIGVLMAIFLYVKRIKISLFPPGIHCKNRDPSITFLFILDIIVILGALGGGMIRIGNFMNSEIIGKPTGGNYGVVFVRELHNNLCQKYNSTIEHLAIRKTSTTNNIGIKFGYQPIELAIAFKKNITDERKIRNFLEESLKHTLVQQAYFSRSPNIHESYRTPLSYKLEKEHGAYKASVYTCGIPRHPSQLYESLSCFLIFIALIAWWHKKRQALAPGRISGAFAIAVFSLRFFYEFYKENQVEFENNMCLNMGQLLSLPAILAGLFLILRRSNKTEQKAM